MGNTGWIATGAVVGLASGALFGIDYALAGLVIGLAGGGAIAWTLARADRPRR